MPASGGGAGAGGAEREGGWCVVTMSEVAHSVELNDTRLTHRGGPATGSAQLSV